MWRPEQFLFPDAGAARTTPAVVCPGPRQAYAFAVTNPRGGVLEGRDLACWSHRDDQWSPPRFIDARLRDSPPVAVSRRPGIVDVFAIGADEHDGQVLTWWNHDTRAGDHFAGPAVLPGPRGLLSMAGLAAVAWSRERLDVFGVSNPDVFAPRRLAHWWWDGTWHGPELLDSRLRDANLAAVSLFDGNLNVFAIGGDDNEGKVLHFWSPDGGDPWGGPVPLPGQDIGMVSDRGGCAAVALSSDQLHVTAPGRGTAGGLDLMHWSWSFGRWTGPTRHPAGRSLESNGRPALVKIPATQRARALATRWPDGAAGPRHAPSWLIDGETVEADAPFFSWLNAFGVAAAQDGVDRMYLAAARDDGKVSVTFSDNAYRPPDRPSLAVTAMSHTHMALDWTIPDRVVRTEVWSDSRILLFNTAHKIAEFDASVRHFEERDLWPGGERYCYFVRGVDALGGFGQSNTVCAQGTSSTRTPPMPVPMPMQLPDLGFQQDGVLVSPTGKDVSLHAGRPLAVRWVTGNFGSAEAPPHMDAVKIWRTDGKPVLVHEASVAVPPLAVGGWFPGEVIWTPPDATTYEAVVELNPDQSFTEHTRANNSSGNAFGVSA